MSEVDVVHDARIWRVPGDPLVAPSRSGSLDGVGIAVKDLFAVSGHRVGAGNPSWLAAAGVESTHAWAVQRLLDSGAHLKGIAQTDEFAYSLAGENAHYGMPPNASAPGRLSGGSSSGSAAAVAAGLADVGLGTDTGGSIRVPASYQGLYGIRPTYGAVPTSGLLALAPSFDTVGWLARDPELLQSVGDVLLPTAATTAGTLVVLPELLSMAAPDVAATVARWAGDAVPVFAVLDLARWAEAFRIVQAHEAWQQHGPWLTGRLHTLGEDVRSRFELASRVTGDDVVAAQRVLDRAKHTILDLVGERVLVLPAAPTVAPRLGSDLGPVRSATMRLTCLAGIAGLPAVTLPLRTADGLPCAACLVASPGTDRALLEFAVQCTERRAA